ncbi:hypothetical protein WAI453_004830 [Rhynchosporium graminicola]
MAATIPELTSRGPSSGKGIDALTLLGKKQVFERRFGLLTIFSFAICDLFTWETVLTVFSQGLNSGGPAELAYGFLISWLL